MPVAFHGESLEKMSCATVIVFNVWEMNLFLIAWPRKMSGYLPYCMTMFEDGLKWIKANDKVNVMDLAEIVSEELG